jgi:hypothetical protein
MDGSNESGPRSYWQPSKPLGGCTRVALVLTLVVFVVGVLVVVLALIPAVLMNMGGGA